MKSRKVTLEEMQKISDSIEPGIFARVLQLSGDNFIKRFDRYTEGSLKYGSTDELQNFLQGLFNWADTEEGEKYWSEYFIDLYIQLKYPSTKTSTKTKCTKRQLHEAFNEVHPDLYKTFEDRIWQQHQKPFLFSGYYAGMYSNIEDLIFSQFKWKGTLEGSKWWRKKLTKVVQIIEKEARYVR